jgi:cation diffusion facilitator family transporter
MDRLAEQKALRYRYTRQAALVGALGNIVLALVKTLFGLLGHSQSLLADGIHSISDLLSDGLVWFAAHHAKEAPDEEHPYGHGRYETIGTMLLGAFLILVGIGIGWDAGERLFEPENLLVPETITLYVALFSILANEGMYHYTRYLARKINSDLLKANAWHHRSDSISSVVVLIGIGGTIAGLPYLDAIAAVVVGMMIVNIGWQLGWGAMEELVDAGLEPDRVEQIRNVIESVSGVANLHMLRTRKMGGHASADVHIQVDPRVSVSEGHRVAEVVQLRLQNEVDHLSDVTVHVDPEDDQEGPSCDGLPLREQAEELLCECLKEIACFEVRKRMLLHYLSGTIDVELFLPHSCYQNPEQSESLLQAYQHAIAPMKEFGEIRLWFG